MYEGYSRGNNLNLLFYLKIFHDFLSPLPPIYFTYRKIIILGNMKEMSS